MTEACFAGERPRALSSLQFPVSLRIVVLAPHADDFDGIGVTMRWFNDRGHRIDIGVLTSGASGVEDGYRGAVTAEAKRDIREVEQRASCRFFGLPDDRLTFLRLAEDETGHLMPSSDNRDCLRAFFLARNPDLVFLPHGNDTNPDHQRTAAFVCEIASASAEPIVACFNRDPKTVSMRADLVAGFGEDDARWKAELLRCHGSQHERNLHTRGHGFDERILRVNRQIAAELGEAVPYAECFEVECLGQRAYSGTRLPLVERRGFPRRPALSAIEGPEPEAAPLPVAGGFAARLQDEREDPLGKGN